MSLVSPVDGIVLGVRGEGTRFRLRVRPDAFLDLRHLLTGHEVKAWAASELDRLQSALGSAGAPAALADGGELAADVGVVLPPERYDVLLAETFLQV